MLDASTVHLTLTGPSLAIVFRTTSIAPEYTPFSAVCNRTLTRSKGCPVTTAKTPPTPPAARSRKLWSDFFVATLTSCSSSCGEGSLSFTSDEDMLGYASRGSWWWREVFGDGSASLYGEGSKGLKTDYVRTDDEVCDSVQYWDQSTYLAAPASLGFV